MIPLNLLIVLVPYLLIVWGIALALVVWGGGLGLTAAVVLVYVGFETSNTLMDKALNRELI